MRTIIIGYGNPLRSDDALGWRVADRLRETVRDPEVEILTLHQLTPELMETLSHADRAIFVDAAAEGVPGAILVRAVQPGPARAAFTHSATPEALLAGAQLLYGHAPQAVLYSVPGADFSLGERLSETVEARLDELVAAILAGLKM
jgi:hydrogenase maturation protease